MSDQKIWDQESFSFTIDFQKQVLIAMLQNKEIFNRLGLYIDYKYFENKDISNIFKSMLEFNQKYKGMPSEESIKEYLSKGNELSESLNETIDELYNAKRIGKEDVDYIEESLSKFIQCQELKKAIISSLDYIGDIDQHDKIKDKITEAINIGDRIENLGTDVYALESVKQRIADRFRRVDIERLSFRWSTMDYIFGGYGKGELFSYIGPSHSGKSMFLINTGVNLLLQMYNVLHLSFEMSEKIMMQRYDMSLLGLTKEEVKSEKMVMGYKEKIRGKVGKLWIKQFPADITTPAEVSRFMVRLASVTEFVPDVLIVDYADIMSSPSRYHEKRHELGAIYRALRNIGVEFQIPVITATQMNRGSLGKLESGKVLDESDIAESYDIMRVLDAGVSIMSSVEDRHLNRATLYVVKNRDGDIGQKIKFYVDWTKAYCKEWESNQAKGSTNG